MNKTPQGRAGRALGWSFAGQLTTQVVSFLAAIALARLLSPTDFGLVGMVAVFVGFLGVFLQGESFLVIGMFISSLTRSQVVAGIGGLGAALLLWLAGLLGDPTSTIGAWLNELSLVAHFEDFTKGVLDTKHVVFYVCFIFFGLFLTLRSLESLRYR